MKTTMKLACLVLAVLVFSATAACAANINFSNDLDIRISITLTYYDANTGALTTQGWWHVEPDSDTVITVNADESREIYYAAFNQIPYIDSTTRGNPTIERWAIPRRFTFTTDQEPYGEPDAWQGRFFRIDDRSVNIDAAR